jgi:hypothetical protein
MLRELVVESRETRALVGAFDTAFDSRRGDVEVVELAGDGATDVRFPGGARLGLLVAPSLDDELAVLNGLGCPAAGFAATAPRTPAALLSLDPDAAGLAAVPLRAGCFDPAGLVATGGVLVTGLGSSSTSMFGRGRINMPWPSSH